MGIGADLGRVDRGRTGRALCSLGGGAKALWDRYQMKRLIETAPMSAGRSRLCHLMAAIFACLVIAPPAIMLLDRRPPLIVEAVSLSPDPARPGDTMTMRWRAREFRACDGTVIRRFVGGLDHVIRETVSQQTMYHGDADGKSREFEVQFVLPILPPGPASYEPITLRWCNVFQQWLWPIETRTPAVTFTVVDRAHN